MGRTATAKISPTPLDWLPFFSRTNFFRVHQPFGGFQLPVTELPVLGNRQDFSCRQCRSSAGIGLMNCNSLPVVNECTHTLKRFTLSGRNKPHAVSAHRFAPASRHPGR